MYPLNKDYKDSILTWFLKLDISEFTSCKNDSEASWWDLNKLRNGWRPVGITDADTLPRHAKNLADFAVMFENPEGSRAWCFTYSFMITAYMKQYRIEKDVPSDT